MTPKTPVYPMYERTARRPSALRRWSRRQLPYAVMGVLGPMFVLAAALVLLSLGQWSAWGIAGLVLMLLLVWPLVWAVQVTGGVEAHVDVGRQEWY